MSFGTTFKKFDLPNEVVRNSVMGTQAYCGHCGYHCDYHFVEDMLLGATSCVTALRNLGFRHLMSLTLPVWCVGLKSPDAWLLPRDHNHKHFPSDLYECGE